MTGPAGTGERSVPNTWSREPGRSPLNPYCGVHALRNRRSLVASGQRPLGVGPMQIPITSQLSLCVLATFHHHTIESGLLRAWTLKLIRRLSTSSPLQIGPGIDRDPWQREIELSFSSRPALASRVEVPVCATRIPSQIHNAIPFFCHSVCAYVRISLFQSTSSQP